jgi:hypothetical protein
MEGYWSIAFIYSSLSLHTRRAGRVRLVRENSFVRKAGQANRQRIGRVGVAIGKHYHAVVDRTSPHQETHMHTSRTQLGTLSLSKYTAYCSASLTTLKVIISKLHSGVSRP